MSYQIMFYGGMIGAIISLIITVVVFVKINIMLVIEDLFGIRFRKKTNNRKGDRGFSFTEQNPKKVTSEIQLKREGRNNEVAASQIDETELIDQESVDQYEDEYGAETTVLSAYEDETTLLSSYEDETTLLTEDDKNDDFKLEMNVMVVHSKTVI
jgi:hypothetical protein